MKKLIAAVAVAATCCTGAFAQTEIYNNPDNHPYFGVRASLDVTCPGDVNIKGASTSIDMMDNGAGFSVGAIYNVPIYYNLYFEPGVTVYKHNAKYKSSIVESSDYSKVTLGEWGFEIPLMFGYHFDFAPIRLSVFTGPEFRVGLSGKTHYTANLNGVKMKGSESIYGDDGAYNRADVSWKFGVGLSYEHYYFAVSGAAGLCNWLNDVEYIDGTLANYSGVKLTQHRNTVSVTLGYNF